MFRFAVGCFQPVLQTPTRFDLALAHWYSYAIFMDKLIFQSVLFNFPVARQALIFNKGEDTVAQIVAIKGFWSNFLELLQRG